MGVGAETGAWGMAQPPKKDAMKSLHLGLGVGDQVPLPLAGGEDEAAAVANHSVLGAQVDLAKGERRHGGESWASHGR